MNSNLDYALAYADIGWHVFPCHSAMSDGNCSCGKVPCSSNAKHPMSHLVPQGHKNATTDKAIIEKWWTKYPDANIAVYLAASGLFCLDIDVRDQGDYTISDLEDIHGATDSDVLALTGGNGEHRIFKAPDYKVGKLGKGIDSKYEGYVILAPSNHKSGGVYEWEASSSPFDNEPSELPLWVRSHASGQEYVDGGGVGVATSFGMGDSQYYDVLDALKFIDNDDRDVWLRVGLALFAANDKRSYGLWCEWSSTSSKFDQADQFRVWRSFRHKPLNGVDLPTIFMMAQNNGWINTKKSTVTSEFEQQSGAITDLSFLNNDWQVAVAEQTSVGNYLPMKAGANKPIPDILKTFPVDILNDVSDWIEGFSRQPNEQITQYATLALASTLCGRMYVSEEGNTTSMFFMVLGDTGIGKNYAKTSIQKFFTETGMTELLSGAGNTASGAVFTALVESPCHIQIIDEIGKQLQTARKQSNGMMAEALSTLVECYSSTTDLMIPKNYSNMGAIASGKAKDVKKIVVHCPAITLLGLATPAQVYDNLSTVEIEDGFLNRLVVGEITQESKDKQRQRRVPLPRHINQWARLIRQPVPTSQTSLVGIDTGYASAPVQTTVIFEDEAYELFDLKGDELDMREKNGEFVLPDMTRRWIENAMRLATCLAVCENALEPTITLTLAHWALEFVEYYGTEFMLNAASKVSDSDFHSLYLKVREFIERSGEEGMSEGELSRHCRAYAASSPAHRDQVLSALVRENVIQQFTFKTQSGRGRPKQSWVAVNNITQAVIDRAK